MRKILSSLAICMIVSQTSYCQQDSLLRKFKFRIGHYQAINLNAATSGNLQQFNPLAATNNNSNFSAGVSAAYSALKSTDRVLLNGTGSLNANVGYNKYNSSSDSRTARNYYLAPAVSILNKWFNKSNFVELGANVRSYGSEYKQTGINIPDDSKNRQSSNGLVIYTGIGKGRLENITDMQNALWLYKELKQENLLSRSLSDDELLGLGQAITQGNNTRVLDARRRTKFTLSTVDKYLQNAGVLGKKDIDYFTSLNDILFFAINDQRLSGTEKYIRFTPRVETGNTSNTQNKNLYRSNETTNYWSMQLTTGLSKYTPVSLTRQYNYGASAKLSVSHQQYNSRSYAADTLTNQAKYKYDLKQAAIDLFYQYAFYPNTRTSLVLNAQSETGYEELGKDSHLYANVSAGFAASYFISYRTRFTCSANLGYQKNNYQLYPNFYIPDMEFNGDFSVGLQVSL
jgi:hypothetical protein